MNKLRIGPASALALGLAGLLCAASVAASPQRHTAGLRAAPTTEPAAPAVQPEDRAPLDAPRWTYLGPDVATVGQLAISPLDPDKLMATQPFSEEFPSYDPLFRSDDAGLHWRSEGGVQAARDVLIDPQGRRIFVGLTALHVSDDDGHTWSRHFPYYPMPNNVVFTEIALRRNGTGDLWGRHSTWNHQEIVRIEQPGFDAWHSVTPAIGSGMKLQGMALSDTQPGTVAIAGVDALAGIARVWVSTDNGDSWDERGHALPASRVADMHFHGDRLLVAMAQGDGDGATGLYASDDFAHTWDHLWGTTGPSTAINQVTFDPGSVDHLWIATEHQGLHRSTDGGQTWELAIGATEGLRTTVVVFDENSDRVWLGVDREGLWLSTDGGDSFSPRAHMLNPLPAETMASNPLDFSELAVGLLYGGHLVTSNDGGTAWELEARAASRVRFDAQGRLFVTQRRTLLRREPNGEWTDMGFVWEGLNVPSGLADVHFGAANDTLLLAGMDADPNSNYFQAVLWRSVDAGAHWTKVHASETKYSRFEQLQRLQTAQGVMLVALHKSLSPTYDAPGQLMGSTDDGQTWASLTHALPSFQGGALCTDGVEMLSLLVSLGDRMQLWRSFDAGTNWTSTDWSPAVGGATGGPFDALYCGGDHDLLVTGNLWGRVLQSLDGGHTFQLMRGGLERFDRPVTDFHATPAGLYMATSAGIWFHPDPGMLPAAPEGLAVVTRASHARALVDLGWTGGAARVDVRRDGVRLATVENTGHFRDRVWSFRETVALGWQVCNAGTDACTAVVPMP